MDFNVLRRTKTRGRSGGARSFVLLLLFCTAGSAQTITEFSLPAGGRVHGITAGSDGNVWFTTTQSASLFLGVTTLPAGGSVTIAVTAGGAVFYGATVDNTTGDPSLQVATPAP